MFDLEFTASDVVRGAWTFVASFVVVFLAGIVGPVKALADSCGTVCDWTTAKAAAVAVGLAAVQTAFVSVKNYVLRSGSKLKG